jgi:uncharacterized membrane protein
VKIWQWADNLIPLPIDLPGLGFLIIISAIILIGYVGSGVISKPVFDLLDDTLSRTPGLNKLYGIVKDMVEAMVGDKRSFKEPVMVEMGPDGLYKLGFVTQKDLSAIEIDGCVAVYFPHAYAISGDLFLVKTEKLKPVQSKKPVLPFIMSGGVADLNEE